MPRICGRGYQARAARLSLMFLLGATTTLATGPAWAAEIDGSTLSQALQLEIFVNGRTTGLIVTVHRDPNGTMRASAADLADLRIPAPRSDSTGDVSLNEISGLTYRYDERDQSLYLTIKPGGLTAQTMTAAGNERDAQGITLAPGVGGFVNYSVFASVARAERHTAFAGASIALDGGIYSPFGEIRQSGLVEHDGRRAHAVRLDTSLIHVMPERNLTLTIGDAIAGGLAWSRPIRFGGIQLQRDFALRPDLVTLPLPSISGTAAVPSSLDIYVNGVRSFSSTVSEGRFQVDNLPAITGGGNARVVLRDIQGREIETVTPYFISGRLLRPGLTEFSLEAGVPREEYGTESFGYRGDPFIAASARHGLYSLITVEGHLELSPHVAVVGAGVNLPTSTFGVLSLAASASASRSGAGALIYASYEADVGGVRITAEARQTFGTYFDLATVNAISALSKTSSARTYAIASVLTPRASERITAAVPLGFLLGDLSLSYAREQRIDGDTLSTTSIFFGTTFAHAVSLTVTAFRTFEPRSATGIFAGVSLPFGGRSNASVSVNHDAGGTSVAMEASRALSPETGSVGWHVSDVEGNHPFRSASLDYQGGVATVHGQIAQNAGTAYANVRAEGSIVFDRSLFFARRLESSFAIVDAGAGNVAVSYQNRQMGATNRRGLFLIPNIRPFERNLIAIDPNGFPVDRFAAQPAQDIRPVGFGGVHVRFGVTATWESAVLHVVDERGDDLPVGAEIILNGGVPQVIGYDGLVQVDALLPRNIASVQYDQKRCQFSFTRVLRENSLLPLGPMQCRAPITYAFQEARPQ